MESNRQKKIAGIIQNDLAAVLQKFLKDAGHPGILISVTKVNVTTDLAIAKAYVSIFPSENAIKIVDEINTIKSQIKHQIAQLTKHQLRKMPELFFFNDDSMDYVEKIDNAIKGKENPLSNPDLLEKRKKS